MTNRALSLLAGFAFLVLTGCASGGAGSGGDAFTMSLGMGSPTNLERNTANLLNRYGYEIERFDQTSNDVYIETRWRVRGVFEEEAEAGYADARNKLYITGRPRGANLNLHLRMTNQGREAGGSWEPMPSTEEFREFAQEIGQELRSEFATGIRVY